MEGSGPVRQSPLRARGGALMPSGRMGLSWGQAQGIVELSEASAWAFMEGHWAVLRGGTGVL